MLVKIDRASGVGSSGVYGRFDLGPAGHCNSVSRANEFSQGVRLEVAPSKRFEA